MSHLGPLLEYQGWRQIWMVARDRHMRENKQLQLLFFQAQPHADAYTKHTVGKYRRSAI
jgi:hypothetical protein